MGPLDVDACAMRLAAFRDEHPEWNIYPGEFGMWHAERDT